ncbi:uncharacterized protein LOC123547319 [Mercenaria mercenaria]|uniref:uncharacterized protein LOC123547319 n=1 Tax=Mercenaria mercenaria TaxID=6596 RepID=UPI00234F2F5E|nr:uncharacterized protein LOC123547319 [Mercenaria mercenaria]XP_045190248.2 uncharacterized protein LOC123547319 [Mercenaria mercenaria]XP_045190249.2 uncharacterized protein LOC123547319 [Mercenaria mercenaria]XP_053407572.1 uncharacterized protein LOC123547319 [Mercenaria mercenaria]
MATNNTILCVPCKSRGVSLTSVKYCKTCKEPLCKCCAECHKTFKATKDHELTQCVEQKSLLATCNDLGNLQMCNQHPNKQTEFYCAGHDTLLCSFCLLKSDNHKQCAKIIEIDGAGKSFISSHFTDNVIDACQKTFESTENTITEIEKANECASKSIDALRCEIEGIRSKMLEAFDRQTNHIMQSVSGDFLDNSTKCKQAIKNLENFEKRVKESETIFKNAVENGATADVFRGVISVLGQCEHFQKEIEQTERLCSRQKVTFERSDLVHALVVDQNPLLLCNLDKAELKLPNSHPGRLKSDFRNHIALIPNDIVSKDTEGQRDSIVESQSSPESLSSRLTHDLKTSSSDAEIEEEFGGSASVKKHQSFLNIEVSYSRSFDVELSEDANPWFGGIVCLPDERLILSDYNNKRIIMVRNDSIISEKEIELKPGNLTLFNQYLVVCLMKKNKLLIMKIKENDLKEYSYLQTRYHPKYVQTVDHERILVSSQQRNGEWYLDLMKLQGQKWRSTRINVELTGSYDGYKLAVQHVPDLQGFRIIQCCEDSDTVQCYHESGGPAIFQYEAENTSSVITDHFGYIFITRHPGEVQVLAPDGTYVTCIHRNAMQRIKFSAFNKSMDKLFITTYKDSMIHVLDVKREEYV